MKLKKERRQQNLEHYVPIIESLGAIEISVHTWRLGRWDIIIGMRNRVQFVPNPKWVMHIEKFLENPKHWIEEGEKEVEKYNERKQSAKNAQCNNRENFDS